MPSKREVDVYKPLAYFAYFGYPLTVFEIWKWQLDPEVQMSLGEIERMLERSCWLRERLAFFQGFYAIGSQEVVRNQVDERHRRYLDAIEKERKLKRVLAYLRYLRGMSGAAVCNSLPFHFTSPKSDIDVFVITKPGVIWSTRFLSVGPLIALAQRPGETQRHPIDLSFFVSERQMDLFGYQKTDDPYFAYWVATLAPVLGEKSTWNRFFKENAWAFSRLPNALPSQRAYRYALKSRRPLIPSLPETFAQRLQEHRLPQDLREAANDDSRVVIHRDMLKFHRTDRREEIARAFKKQLEVCDV